MGAVAIQQRTSRRARAPRRASTKTSSEVRCEPESAHSLSDRARDGAATRSPPRRHDGLHSTSDAKRALGEPAHSSVVRIGLSRGADPRAPKRYCAYTCVQTAGTGTFPGVPHEIRDKPPADDFIG